MTICPVCRKEFCDSMGEEIEHRAASRTMEAPEGVDYERWGDGSLRLVPESIDPEDALDECYWQGADVIYTSETRKPYTPTQAELDW